MDHRRLGQSGLKVPALSLGTGTFGGTGPLFGAWGTTDANEARRLIDICLDAGATLFDTADVYSQGASEEVLGQAIKGRRDRVLISTKTSLPMGDGPQEAGSSRSRLIRACEDALRRLGTDHIDLLQLHAFDAGTPVEEVLATLDMLVRAGKVRYTGVSNFAGWLYRIVDVLDEIARETGRSVPQIAINWLLQRPTVASVIIGARNEAQLRDNLGAVGWSLTREQIAALDVASERTAPYPHFPYRRQAGFARLNPPPV